MPFCMLSSEFCITICHMKRRLLLKQIAALGVASSVSPALERAVMAQEGVAPNTLKYFPGFKAFTVKTSGSEINGVIGGSGPPILLLHGAPQSHITWRKVAPMLAKTRTVIAADLRGYGDSGKPPDGDNHANYSKRAMAL